MLVPSPVEEEFLLVYGIGDLFIDLRISMLLLAMRSRGSIPILNVD